MGDWRRMRLATAMRVRVEKGGMMISGGWAVRLNGCYWREILTWSLPNCAILKRQPGVKQDICAREKLRSELVVSGHSNRP